MSAKITPISSTPMANLIRIGSHAVVPDASTGLNGYGLSAASLERPASPHYNTVGSSFADVLGLNHQQLVDEAVAEKAADSPPLH